MRLYNETDFLKSFYWKTTNNDIFNQKITVNIVTVKKTFHKIKTSISIKKLQ